MSQWGLSIEDATRLTDTQITGLLGAYVERKRFEAKVTLSVVAEALTKPKDKELSLAGLSMMGFAIEGLAE